MARKIPETINEIEFSKIIKVTNKDRHKLAFALGFYQGMRISEIINLKPEHIDKGQKLIKIKEGKGKKDRNIPIMPEVMKYLKYLPVGCGARALQIAFKRYSALSKIDRDIYFHCLRHSSATWLLNEKRWDIRHVQQFLGHSRIETTQIYTHVAPQNLLDLVWGKE